MRRVLLLCALLVVLAGVVESWRLLNPKSSGTTLTGDQPAPVPDPPKPTPGVPWFEDVTQGSGIDFQHFDPATPQHFIQETMGSGLAWIDYNNDGWPDLFCVQAGPVRPAAAAVPLPTNKLYRNN